MLLCKEYRRKMLFRFRVFRSLIEQFHFVQSTVESKILSQINCYRAFDFLLLIVNDIGRMDDVFCYIITVCNIIVPF